MLQRSYPLALVIALLGACADDDPVTGPGDGSVACTTPAFERLLPLVIGATWTYDTSDRGAPNIVKTSTVEALEDVGERKAGVTAYRVRTGKAGTSGDVVSWQEDRCTSVVRHREQSFDLSGVLVTDQFYVPAKLRVDESPAYAVVGATWTTEYTEVEVDPVAGTTTTSKRETWRVEALDEVVAVPAGTFPAVRVRKITSGQADKTYWYARGVGKVREAGEQVEILTAYTVPQGTP